MSFAEKNQGSPPTENDAFDLEASTERNQSQGQVEKRETVKWQKGPGLSTIVDPQESLTGQTIDGRYLIKQKLGQGGFGVVYLATDEKMVSRPVVVKVVLHRGIGDEWSLKKFQHEIEALARVDHPGIVGIFDAGELPDGRPYLVMQYVEGVSMRTAIRAEGMEFSRAGNIIRYIGRALSAAHSKGILHRDLKPENVMLRATSDGDEQVKIIDFGIAKLKDSVTALSTGGERTVGTIAYMSPEQLSALPLSQTSDVFSFGVLSYEMLTGRRPFNPESVYQLLEMQRAGVRVKPMDLRPGLPEAAQDALLNALSFEPQNRYERAREFGDALAWALLNSDERTKPGTGPLIGKKPLSAHSQATLPQTSDSLALETAHILFLEIVNYATFLIDEQLIKLFRVQEILRGTAEYQRAQAADQLLLLSSRDGIALAFFSDPEAPVRCAFEVCRIIKEQSEIELRLGIHSGMVYRLADINTNMNVAGGGISIAQAVMGCGDPGHILVSKRVADDLGQLSRWANNLHDLGKTEFPGGGRVHLFNLHTDDIGNPKVPAKLRPAKRAHLLKRIRIGAIAIATLVLMVGISFWAWRLRSNTVVANQTPAPTSPGQTPAAISPDQWLVYWLTVQKFQNRQPIGDPFASAGDNIYGNGWKFRFNVQPGQAGALYLLNEGPGPGGQSTLSILFPTPQNNGGSSALGAKQLILTGWNTFNDYKGVERLWIIWSAKSLPELEPVFADAAKTKGVVINPSQIDLVKGQYLKLYETQKPEAKTNKQERMTFVHGHNDILVSLVELTHEAQ